MGIETVVQLEIEAPVARITLDDPERRNAMTIAMFDGIDDALTQVAARNDVHVVRFGGHGPAFCAGFDLGAAIEDQNLMATFILRLSTVNRALRRLPAVVVGAIHGAAIAGGCAMTSACDIVYASPRAKFGYPVHGMGVSPAVTTPTLLQAIGGHARSLMLGGAIIDGTEAHRIGLADFLSASEASFDEEVEALITRLSGHGPEALRVTKHWLNELDGSLDDARFDGPAFGSTEVTQTPEAAARLREFWIEPAPGAESSSRILS